MNQISTGGGFDVEELFSFSVEGLGDLERALNALPEKVARYCLMRSAQKAAKQMTSRISQEAPQGKTGHLKAGIKSVIRTYSNGVKGVTILVVIGLKKTPKGGRRIPDDAFYGRFVQQGTAAHVINVRKDAVLSNGVTIFGRKLQHPGARKNEFFSRGFNSTKAAVIETFKSDLAENLTLAVEAAKA